MSFFEQPFKLGTSGKLYENLADPGSMLFGGAGKSNSLGQKRDEKKQGIDWFGSPITAGTDTQDMARLAAILYGSYMGAGAMGGGSSATGAAAAPSASPGGAGSVGGLGGLGGMSAPQAGSTTGTISKSMSPMARMRMAMMANKMMTPQQQPNQTMQTQSPYGYNNYGRY